MKVILTSDTHKERSKIEAVKQFALDNEIETIVDCGDLHGAIDAYQGINLHAVFWDEASGGMDRWGFTGEMSSIDATTHENGSTFVLDNTAIYIRHNLADYNSQIPESRLCIAKTALDELVSREEKELEKLVLFGHTHNFHFHKEDDVIALNPGSLGLNDPAAFIVLDLETKAIEYRTFDRTILRISEEENSDVVQVRNLFTNEEGTRLEYIARTNDDQERFVFNGQESAKYKSINSLHRIIDDLETERTLDDYAMAVTKNNDQEILVFQGKESQEYDSILSIKDVYDQKTKEKTVMFLAEKDQKQLWVTLDGKETSSYGEIKETPKLVDGELFYLAKREKEDENARPRKIHNSVLIRGWNETAEELMEYKRINLNSLVSDGNNVAVNVGHDWDKEFVNCNGKETESYDKVSETTLLEGKLAFVAKKEDQEFAVFNGRRHKAYHNPSRWDHVINNLTLVQGKLAYSVLVDGKESIVSRGKVVAGPFPKTEYSRPVREIRDVNDELFYAVNQDKQIFFCYRGKETLFERDAESYGVQLKKVICGDK
jgi:putative phosphoesterase